MKLNRISTVLLAVLWSGCGEHGSEAWADDAFANESTALRQNASLRGHLDAWADGRVSGWAYSTRSPGASVQVHVYADGQFAAGRRTTIVRGDVNSTFGITGEHGFSFALPARFQRAREVRVYVLDPHRGPSAELGGSPRRGGADARVRADSVVASNPIVTGDHPDPTVYREREPDGTVRYYMSATVSRARDFPVVTSTDLATWTAEPRGLFGRPGRGDGSSYEINGQHFCSMWGPRITRIGARYVLFFTARRYATRQAVCPEAQAGDPAGSLLDTGIFVATANSPTGPFATDTAEPRPFGRWSPCPGDRPGAEARRRLPQSEPYAGMFGCRFAGGQCTATVRIDANVFTDTDGRVWAPYTWYTNSPPGRGWESQNHGSHMSIVELDPTRPGQVACDATQVFAVNSRDPGLETRLAASCPSCGEVLGMNRNRFGQPGNRDGVPWAVAEGGTMARAGGLVYLFFSHSYWDSPFYSIAYVAAPTVEQLRFDNPRRVVGRLTIPRNRPLDKQAFGTGTVVLGPDDNHWFYISHHLRDGLACQQGRAPWCSRDLWLMPVSAHPAGGGRLQTIRPAGMTRVTVPLR